MPGSLASIAVAVVVIGPASAAEGIMRTDHHLVLAVDEDKERSNERGSGRDDFGALLLGLKREFFD